MDASKRDQDEGCLGKAEAGFHRGPGGGPQHEDVRENGDQVPLVGAGIA